MRYEVSWDGPSAQEPDRGWAVEVSTAGELDEVLERVGAQAAAEDLPFAVQIHQPQAPGSVMIGVGHPERSFIDWLAADGDHRFGYQPTLAAPPEPVVYDVYGEWHEHPPARLRVTPATARQAAREYLRTGRRPECVEWASE